MKKVINILRGSVGTPVKCDGIFDDIITKYTAESEVKMINICMWDKIRVSPF